jgi:hypothetical protein
MKTAGLVLLILGIVGTIAFGIQAIQQSESVSFLGIEIVASTADWTPVIISAVILVIGIIMMNSARSRATY